MRKKPKQYFAKQSAVPVQGLEQKGARGNLLLLLWGLTLINGVFYGLYAIKLLFHASFFYNPLEGYAGPLGDFFNPIQYAYHLNPMAYQWSNSPPFLHFFSYLCSLLLRGFTAVEGGIAMARTPPGQVGFALLGLGMISTLFFAINRFTKRLLSGMERCWLCAMACSAYPFFYALAGGNFVLLAAAMIALFLVCYEKKRYALAAVWLGVAAALKLYPALLGVLFLTDKRWKEALLCAAIGVGLTFLSLAAFQGGVDANLLDFLEKSTAYNHYGNQDLRRIMMDNNSLLMLWDIPLYIARGSAVSLEEMAAHNAGAMIVQTGLLIFAIGSCFLLRRRQDRILLLCLWMIGYPYNSAPYNLSLLAVPLAYWACLEEKQNTSMIVMGVLLMMCKTRFAFYATNVRHITMQSALNPVLIAGMLCCLYISRRKEMREDMRRVHSLKA